MAQGLGSVAPSLCRNTGTWRQLRQGVNREAKKLQTLVAKQEDFLEETGLEQSLEEWMRFGEAEARAVL